MCTAQKVKSSVQCNKTQYLQQLDEKTQPTFKILRLYGLKKHESIEKPGAIARHRVIS